MIDIKTSCPHCKQPFAADPDLVGKTVPCPICKKIFTVRVTRVIQKPTLQDLAFSAMKKDTAPEVPTDLEKQIHADNAALKMIPPKRKPMEVNVVALNIPFVDIFCVVFGVMVSVFIILAIPIFLLVLKSIADGMPVK